MSTPAWTTFATANERESVMPSKDEQFSVDDYTTVQRHPDDPSLRDRELTQEEVQWMFDQNDQLDAARMKLAAEMAEDLDWGRFLEDLDPETVVNGVDARSGEVMSEPPEPVTVPTEQRFGARLLDAAIGGPEEQARVRRIAAAIDKDAELERGRIRLELKTAVRILYQVHDAVIESDIEAVIDRIVLEVRP